MGAVFSLYIYIFCIMVCEMGVYAFWCGKGGWGMRKPERGNGERERVRRLLLLLMFDKVCRYCRRKDRDGGSWRCLNWRGEKGDETFG